MGTLKDRLGKTGEEEFEIEVTMNDGESLDIEELLRSGLSPSELRELADRLRGALEDLLAAEPRGRKSEAHEDWEYQVEDLQDLIDEVYEWMERGV